MFARVVSANGKTGTTMPYTKMSVKMAELTVRIITVFELRRRRNMGGLVEDPVSHANIAFAGRSSFGLCCGDVV